MWVVQYKKEERRETQTVAERQYVAIDLKSFYASVECVERGLNPLKTNLVVADAERTDKTICLAVSPSLKSLGVSSRPRLFEVKSSVRGINAERRRARGYLAGESCDIDELNRDTSLGVSYITATPRMAKYIEYSTKIYGIYLRFVAPEDIHVYSIDEVFIDVTGYLKSYKMTARELTVRMIREVLRETGITATAGIGTNMYLCKVAMDIVAKHLPADKNGVRIAELDERSYREKLWSHTPLTDFWRVGRGYAKSLEKIGLYTMGDIARCSIGGEREYYNEELLYKLFGVNAELLIDHAWGHESCTMEDVKRYQPRNHSMSVGQVLHCPYTAENARLVALEMADQVSLDLVREKVLCDRITLAIGYDRESLTSDGVEVALDYYGRAVPKGTHGTYNFGKHTSLTSDIMAATGRIFDSIVNKALLIRRISIATGNTVSEKEYKKVESIVQLDIFSPEREETVALERESRERESRIQHALLDIKDKFGKNAIVRGMDLEEGATAIARNGQIGGHRA